MHVCTLIDLSSSDFDAIEELHGGLGALRLPPPQPTSHEYGAYLRQQRQQREACKLQKCTKLDVYTVFLLLIPLQCSNSISYSSCNMEESGLTPWDKRYIHSVYIVGH